METITEMGIITPSVTSELLEQVEESSFTVLHCKYTTSPRFTGGWWVNIWNTSHLTCGGESLPLLHAINIPLAPQRHYLKNFGDSLRFALFFPKLPAHWSRFDFIERCGSHKGLVARGIKRNGSGIYRVTVA